jgi:methionyl-tRNA formyltransferase
MRVVLLTSIRRGLASRCLTSLCDNRAIQVVGVVFARRASTDRWKLAKRKIAKTVRIGVLGAVNGIRMRSWYAERDATDIFAVCAALNVPIGEVDAVNGDGTKRILRQASADLGLSLGNSYLGESVFKIPKHGMINVHTEILPRFQGAQSIIWPIFEGVDETGFTIHQISKQLDGGAILYRRKHRIRFWPTLKETVVRNLTTVRSEIPAALVHVCENYAKLRAQAGPPLQGRSYTTPTIAEFARMVKNNRALYRSSAGAPIGLPATDAVSAGPVSAGPPLDPHAERESDRLHHAGVGVDPRI